jgi:hypothetical protein
MSERRLAWLSEAEYRGNMFSACANPDCGKAFDYRQGQFFRFHKAHRPEDVPPNTHSVQHFWLCGICSENYTLNYMEDHGVIILPRVELYRELEHARAVSAA